MLDRAFHKFSLFLVPLICCTLLGYFSYHAFYGGNGMVAAQRLKERIALLESQRAEATALRISLEKKVALLRPESLDPDILDEYARALLGKALEKDIVILRPHMLGKSN